MSVSDGSEVMGSELQGALQDEIVAAVAEGFDEQVVLTQDLIRHPSVRGQEQTAQDFLADHYRARGYGVDRWALNADEISHHPGFSPVSIDYENSYNVVASHRPREEKGRSLILNGHVDVVPVGPLDMWTNPPYEPIIDGDWLYGRGSGDMKAGLALNLAAMDALRRLGYQPAARVHLQSVVEEECTGNGALAALLRGYNADAAIITEPTNHDLVRANLGVIWFRVHLRGKPVHVLEAGSGANAIEAAFGLIQALKELEQSWNARKADKPYFKDCDHPINFNVGKIEGGDWASSVPAWCSFDVRIGLYPGEKPADAMREIEDALRAASRKNPFLANNPPEVEVNGFFAEGYVLEEGSDAEALLQKVHATSFSAPLNAKVMPCYLDGRVFAIYGDTPCLVYGPVSDNIHGFDERVSLGSIRQVTTAVALYIAEWCGLEKI
ncbi:ArgE/DapE family deacylase [Rhodovibrionaceae bacterium A322]